jgi:bifunctional UDP-N-acetylglucosamine pyrophosphorylase/glucosamine-1-phosphate N-acetyltransferase
MPLEVIILAAGQGKRMRSARPKVLHAVGGRPMLSRVVDAARTLGPASVHIVTGHGGDQVRSVMASLYPGGDEWLHWAYQAEQKGTGHAVLQALPAVAPRSRCLVLVGDVPLLDPSDLERLTRMDAPLCLLTATPSSPAGLGRILRNENGDITGIVEERDASEAERAIGEINTGIMLCAAADLARWLDSVGCDNQQGEFYLTDIVAIAVAEGAGVAGVVAADADRLLGINSRADLALAERGYQRLAARSLMEDGVTLLDPARVDIRGRARFGSDCVVDVNVVLEGDVVAGNDVIIGPGCIIRNSRIGDHCHIHPNTLIEDSVLGDHCNVGPFARLRPQTRLADGVRIGNFVEIKNSEFGDGAKANHLAYVGDSGVGANTNIGAGVITCNYDGANKHRTEIGADVFVGSDSQLVAPVRIADGVTIGAGSTITRNITQPALVLSRSKQLSVPGWQRPVKKPPAEEN